MDALDWLRSVHRSTLSPKARAVAAVLFAHMDPDGSHCWPSLDTIAREAGYSKRDAILGRRATARHAARLGPLDELERGGWLIRLRRPGQGRGHKPTAYYATVPPDGPAVEVPRDEGQQVPPSEGQQVPRDEGHDLDTDLVSDLVSEDPRSPTSGDDLDAVDVLADYLDNAHAGGQRLAALGIDDPADAIRETFDDGTRDARACWAGFVEAKGRGIRGAVR